MLGAGPLYLPADALFDLGFHGHREQTDDGVHGDGLNFGQRLTDLRPPFLGHAGLDEWLPQMCEPDAMEDIRDPVGMAPHLGGGGEGLVGGEAQAMKGIADAGHPVDGELCRGLYWFVLYGNVRHVINRTICSRHRRRSGRTSSGAGWWRSTRH